MPETAVPILMRILPVLMSQPQKKVYLLLSLPDNIYKGADIGKAVANNSVIKLNVDTVRSSDSVAPLKKTLKSLYVVRINTSNWSLIKSSLLRLLWTGFWELD